MYDERLRKLELLPAMEQQKAELLVQGVLDSIDVDPQGILQMALNQAAHVEMKMTCTRDALIIEMVKEAIPQPQRRGFFG